MDERETIRVWPVTVGPSQQVEWDLAYCVTDRWGELNENCNDMEALRQLETDEALLGRLREQMWDYLTFVVRKDGQFGILFEIEYACRESEVDFDDAPGNPWRPYANAVIELWSGMQRWMPQFPVTLQWAVPDSSLVVFGRPAAWVFAPDGALTADERERLGNLLLLL